jgi:hypothetical protein
MLNSTQRSCHVGIDVHLREDRTDEAVELVDRAAGLYPNIALVNARAIRETGRAIVARARVDLAESVSHVCAP